MFNFVIIIIIINSQQFGWFSKGVKHFLFMLMLKTFKLCSMY